MGADGHTAGIMPASPALSSDELAVYYNHSDYQRITVTAKALSRLDEAVLYASGDNKRQAVSDLLKDLPSAQQPAQIIKQIPSWSVYND
jgi:6-phosphogluconolactonase/glucosamine-6-phosphate isomerase/deaminase